MYIGKAWLAIVSVSLLSTLLFVSCSNRGKGRIEISSLSKEATTTDVQKELSGIWYHSRYEEITTPMESSFSWGVGTYDYRKALRIDLLGDQRFLGLADVVWNNVTAEIDSTNRNVVKLHLKQKDSPENEEVIVTLEGEGVISIVFTTNVEIGMTKRIAGKYYRVFTPESLPSDRKDVQTGHE